MTALAYAASPTASDARVRPPVWLILATAMLALVCLALAVAETNLGAHYLIDDGEYISLFGLAFILAAGIALYRSQRLFVSLPLIFPWLIYPIITQGDQIIDNLSITSMRVICHLLLAAIFGTPVAVMVLSARYALAPTPGGRTVRRAWTSLFPGLRPLAEGRHREGTALLAAALFVLEMWLADQYLGTLMIVTLIVMTIGVLLYGSLPETPVTGGAADRARAERFALATLVVGVIVSFGGYVGYKNRPGAYQGSPSFFMDPTRKDTTYPLDRIAVPSRAPAAPSAPEAVRDALTAYARSLERLLAGYHLLDRNYNYDFHNALFIRHTPLVPNYPDVGRQIVDDARRLRAAADTRAALVRPALTADDPLAALLDDVRSYVAFNFDRAPILDRMSREFAKTPAGLQHATHLYEGEGKFLSTRLSELVGKHNAIVNAPSVRAITSEFAAVSRSIHETYANRIVGF